MAKILPVELEALLRGLYASGQFEDAQPMLDRRTPRARLMQMLCDFEECGLLRAEMLAPHPSYERCHELYVRLRAAPAWRELNVDAIEGPEEKRVQLVRDNGGAICYWAIKLSRLSPYFVDCWNTFVEDHGRVVPRETQPPGDYEWSQIQAHVGVVLEDGGWVRLPDEIASCPVPWIDTATWPVVPYNENGPPNVYECLIRLR